MCESAYSERDSCQTLRQAPSQGLSTNLSDNIKVLNDTYAIYDVAYHEEFRSWWVTTK